MCTSVFNVTLIVSIKNHSKHLLIRDPAVMLYVYVCIILVITVLWIAYKQTQWLSDRQAITTVACALAVIMGLLL